MQLDRLGCKPILNPTEKQIARALSLTKSSFASLTAPDGAYLQVGGGPGLFMLEYRNHEGKHFRGRQELPVVQFPDGTIISFTGNQIPLAQREWFLRQQIAEVFCAFSEGLALPSTVEWIELSQNFTRGHA